MSKASKGTPQETLVMTWTALVCLVVLVCSWALFLSGALEIPGWEGFGKGLAIGSLTGLAPIINFAVAKLRRTSV